MEENEMLEQTNETENIDTQTIEESEEQGLELTDTQIEQPEQETKEVEQPNAPSKVEFTPEQQAKLDEILLRRVKATERKYERELNKRENLIEKLKVGMGKDSLEELDEELTSYYESQGIKMPTPKTNERDELILAKADAEEIIDLGLEEMERVANDIANKPREVRTIREKTILTELVSKIAFEKAKTVLEAKGADIKILEDKEFKNFSSKFSATTPIAEVYDLFEKINKTTTTPTQPPKPIGSVKSNVVNNEIKEYYTPEEISKFTREDYLKNPRLMEAVENSLAKK